MEYVGQWHSSIQLVVDNWYYWCKPEARGMKKTTNRPNVVFVLTDDQGYGDLSCLGNPTLKTPAIDKLATESIRFTDFHVCPVCTPTRGELMTGRDALRNGATFVCMGRSLMRADLPTMADIFSDNGYRTGHFGKWHLGDNYPYRPQDRGFQESVWHPAWGLTSAPDYFENDYFDDHYRHRDIVEQYKGYCTDVWFEEATKWIGKCREAGDPFFAYIATNAPHGPLWVPGNYREPYSGKVEDDEASFFGMIACIDENMARLDSFLRETGLAENTILIFMTDNGTATGENVFNAGMRGKKTSLYDGGHRVPFYLRWPEKRHGGRDVDDLSRSTDVLPTLIDLCDLDIDDGLEFDGISLGTVIRNEAKEIPDRMSVVQYGHINENIKFGKTGKYGAAILWKKWRLVDGTELYDTADDPGQARNVAAFRPEVVAGMKAFYDEWWDGVGENLGIYQPIIIGSPYENPTRLCSADWAWVYADNQEGIRGCVMDSGTWHVEAAAEGLYSVGLRRWPEESGLGITSSAPVMNGFDGTLPKGKALPVASAWLQAGRTEQILAVPPDAAEVSFNMKLEQGSHQIKSWWIDENENRLAGAYYLTAVLSDK
jgi:arylsulfatase A-like enzyme